MMTYLRQTCLGADESIADHINVGINIVVLGVGVVISVVDFHIISNRVVNKSEEVCS